jgi:hypothetical protein
MGGVYVEEEHQQRQGASTHIFDGGHITFEELIFTKISPIITYSPPSYFVFYSG